MTQTNVLCSKKLNSYIIVVISDLYIYIYIYIYIIVVISPLRFCSYIITVFHVEC